MSETQTATISGTAAGRKTLQTVGSTASPPTAITLPQQSAAVRLRDRLALDTFTSPVNQNGSFEFDRVIKSSYVQKRTQKTKTWKPIFLVLRPNALSIYKTDKEDKLRHKIYLSDVTAVTLLKDSKRQYVFGLFSPARNFHFQAPTAKDAHDWVDVLRKEARIEEEEEEMFLASPVVHRQSYLGNIAFSAVEEATHPSQEHERFASSSPEPPEPLSVPKFRASAGGRRASQPIDSSGNELASHSDFSDTDVTRQQGGLLESLAVQPLAAGTGSGSGSSAVRPSLALRNVSQVSGINVEHDPDRVMWQGWLWLLRSRRGVRQWKKSWAVLRPRNLILYKDESEYVAQFIVHMGSIVGVVDLDPVSRTRTHCMQIITEEKGYKFCAQDEEALVQCLGAFKSLLAKRRELEARAVAAAAAASSSAPEPVTAGAA